MIRPGSLPHAMLAATAAAAAVLLSLVAAPVGAGAETLALVHGTIHTVSGATIPDGTVVVDGTKITAVGAGVVAPPGARVLDCTGKQVYPGFVSPYSQIGLIEIGSVLGGNDTQETGDVNPNIRAEVMLNPDSEVLPVTRLNGITSALVVPGGGIVRGTSAVMHLDGWTQEDMTLRAPVGLHVNWPNMAPVHAFFITQSDDEQMKTRDQNIQKIRDAFDDARAYWTAHKAENGAGIPKHDADAKWDAMRRVYEGDLPVYFHADHLNQLKAVLQFADDEGIKKLVIVGGYDAWRIADELKKRDIPVIVGGVLATPDRSYEAYDEAYAVPAKLAAAGVRYCISDGASDTFNARNLPYHAGMAVAFGLPQDEALKSVTLYAAQILGVGDKVGSIEPGKLADLQITDGDPLLDATHCEQVILNGKVLAMESRQTRLFHKYDARPRGPKARPRR